MQDIANSFISAAVKNEKREIFERMDQNKDGVLSLSELRDYVPLVIDSAGTSILAHANCTPFFSPKHLDFATEKNRFFCHLENTVFQTLPKNAFFISFAHFLLFLGGSNNHSLVQNQRVHRSFSPKKNFVG